MTKTQLQLYFYQFNDPNHEHYLDNAWWAGIVNQYLQEL